MVKLSVEEAILVEEFQKDKFTEKERDAGTDLDYFGARYYNSNIGMWLQVDPLADKYRGWSSYNYTLCNPLRYIDIKGMYSAESSDGSSESNPLEDKEKEERSKKEQNKVEPIAYNLHTGEPIYPNVLPEREEGLDYDVIGPIEVFGFAYGFANISVTAAKKGGKVFWSGGKTAQTAAEYFAKENGMKTLEMTSYGKIMNTLNPILPRTISNPIWNMLSGFFANSTRGAAHVFHNASAGVRVNSVWATKEFPILIKKEVEIIFHNIFD